MESIIGPQRDAVAAIKHAGGEVCYEWQWRNGQRLRSAADPPWPKWLVSALGQDCFGNVVAVDLSGGNANDATMIHVGRLTHLKRLNLFTSRVTSAGLAQVGNLHELEDLGILNIVLTDADLAHLGRCTKLPWLYLSGRQITNKGLAHLANMRGLKILSLFDTSVTTLEPIRGLTQLNQLAIAGSRIEDNGLEPVAGFTNLQVLNLSRTGVGDAGIRHLSTLSNLAQLTLEQTKVGDASVGLLFELPMLHSVDLHQTEVTDAGLLALAAKINASSCRVLSVYGPNVTAAGIRNLRGSTASRGCRTERLGAAASLACRQPDRPLADQEMPQ